MGESLSGLDRNSKDSSSGLSNRQSYYKLQLGTYIIIYNSAAIGTYIYIILYDCEKVAKENMQITIPIAYHYCSYLRSKNNMRWRFL